MRSNDGTRDLDSQELRAKLYALKTGIDQEKAKLQAMKSSMPETSEHVQAQHRLVQSREIILHRIVTHLQQQQQTQQQPQQQQQQQNGQFPMAQPGQNVSGMPQNTM